jgi:hypothetical protein
MLTLVFMKLDTTPMSLVPEDIMAQSYGRAPSLCDSLLINRRWFQEVHVCFLTTGQQASVRVGIETTSRFVAKEFCRGIPHSSIGGIKSMQEQKPFTSSL